MQTAMDQPVRNVLNKKQSNEMRKRSQKISYRTFDEPRRNWEYTLCMMAYLILCFTPWQRLFGQSHCDRDKLFVAEMKVELNVTGIMQAPDMSSGLGISGIYGKGTLLDNFSALIGLKSMTQPAWASKSGKESLQIIPTTTLLYKYRPNGYDSKVVHVLAAVSGLQGHYYGFDYRIYRAPTGQDFATIGAIIGWNNYSGFNVGFAVMGFF